METNELLKKQNERKSIVKEIVFNEADLVTEMTYTGELKISYLDFEKDDYDISEKYFNTIADIFNNFNNEIFIKEIIDTKKLEEKFRGKKADTLAVSNFRNEIRKQISEYVVKSDFTSMEEIIWNYVKERI